MIFLGIGSNLSSSFGGRFKNIDLAISFLETYKINIIKKSSLYESFSYPNKNNPKFINSVIAVETKLPPTDLMSVLIFVEEKLERKRSKKNDPRTHDLDESLRLGDHIGILNGGRLVQVGTPIDIIMKPADDYVEKFVKDVNRAKSNSNSKCNLGEEPRTKT